MAIDIRDNEQALIEDAAHCMTLGESCFTACLALQPSNLHRACIWVGLHRREVEIPHWAAPLFKAHVAQLDGLTAAMLVCEVMRVSADAAEWVEDALYDSPS